MIRRLLLPTCCLALFAFTASAQSLVHSYEFTSNLNDSTGSIALTNPNGGSVSSGFYNFAGGEGLKFVGELGLQSTYTIAIRYKFDFVSGFRRIISFKDLGDENGAYVANGVFTFYNSGQSGGSTSNNTYADFILTRDGSGNVRAYDGSSATPLFSFTDTANDAVANGAGSATNSVLWFFKDNGIEESPGQADRILIYDGALTGAATVGILSAIPEPSTYAAMAGAAALGLAIWHRRRRQVAVPAAA